MTKVGRDLCPLWRRPLQTDILLISITLICNWTLIHLVLVAAEGRHRLESYVWTWRNLRLACICGEIKNKMKLIWKMRGLELAVSWLVTHGTCQRWPEQKKERPGQQMGLCCPPVSEEPVIIYNGLFWEIDENCLCSRARKDLGILILFLFLKQSPESMSLIYIICWYLF